MSAERRNALAFHNALTSTALGDALDGEKSDLTEIVRKLHVNWGRASPQQLKRSMAEADGKASDLILLVGEFVGPLVRRRRFRARRPPRRPPPGAADLLFLDNLVVLHVIDLFSRYSLLAPVRTRNPGEVWDTFRTSWIAVFGNPG